MTTKLSGAVRLWLDTEFTDFTNPRLISVGLAAENGAEFYAELSDGWAQRHCSDFVLDTVLPLLDGTPGVLVDRAEASRRLREWLAGLGGDVVIICDVEVDWLLLSQLLQGFTCDANFKIDCQLLEWPGSALARRYDDLVDEMFAGEDRRHHSLVDARVMRNAVLQVEAEFKAGC